MFYKLGNQSEEILDIRNLLITAGFPPEDGKSNIFTEEVLQAVMDFQATHYSEDGAELKVDGEVGPKTLWALKNPSYFPQTEEVGGDAGALTLEDETSVGAKAAREGKKLFDLGLKEIPDGSNSSMDLYTYMWVYYKNLIPKLGPGYGVAWCAAFAFRNVMKVVGTDSDIWYKPGEASWNKAPGSTLLSGAGVVSWAKKKGFLYKRGEIEPEPGVIFAWHYDGGSGHHIGMVYNVINKDTIYTVEGNVSNAVRMRKRNLLDKKFEYFIKWF